MAREKNLQTYKPSAAFRSSTNEWVRPWKKWLWGAPLVGGERDGFTFLPREDVTAFELARGAVHASRKSMESSEIFFSGVRAGGFPVMPAISLFTFCLVGEPGSLGEQRKPLSARLCHREKPFPEISHWLRQPVRRRGRNVLVVKGALVRVRVLPVDLELGHSVEENKHSLQFPLR